MSRHRIFSLCSRITFHISRSCRCRSTATTRNRSPAKINRQSCCCCSYVRMAKSDKKQTPQLPFRLLFIALISIAVGRWRCSLIHQQPRSICIGIFQSLTRAKNSHITPFFYVLCLAFCTEQISIFVRNAERGSTKTTSNLLCDNNGTRIQLCFS